MRSGRGEATTRRHPPVGVLDDVPAVLLAAQGRLGGIHERADRLAGAVERRVVAVDLGLGDDRDDGTLDAQPVESVLQVLPERVPKGTLCVRPRHIERDPVQLMCRELGTAQDEPHLRAVTVPDHDVPPLGDHDRNVLGRLLRRQVLAADVLVRPVLDQRVAADGHDRELAHGVTRI